MGHFRWLKPLLIWSAWILFLAGFQTTVWPLVVGGVPAPQLWLNVVLFFIVFRKMIPALFISYAMVALLSPFTSLSLGVFWTSLLFLVPLGSMLKARTFWPGLRYFIIGSLVLSVGWHITSFIVSQMVEKNPASLHFFTRLTEILLTPLAAVPQYVVMQWIDRSDNLEVSDHFNEVVE